MEARSVSEKDAQNTMGCNGPMGCTGPMGLGPEALFCSATSLAPLRAPSLDEVPKHPPALQAHLRSTVGGAGHPEPVELVSRAGCGEICVTQGQSPSRDGESKQRIAWHVTACMLGSHKKREKAHGSTDLAASPGPSILCVRQHHCTHRPEAVRR